MNEIANTEHTQRVSVKVMREFHNLLVHLFLRLYPFLFMGIRLPFSLSLCVHPISPFLLLPFSLLYIFITENVVNSYYIIKQTKGSFKMYKMKLQKINNTNCFSE